MRIRLVAGVLWLLAVAAAYELAWYFFGVPRSAGPVLAVIAAAFITIDPAGLLWTARRTHPASRSAATHAARPPAAAKTDPSAA